jgi:hypothetical protein
MQLTAPSKLGLGWLLGSGKVRPEISGSAKSPHSKLPGTHDILSKNASSVTADALSLQQFKWILFMRDKRVRLLRGLLFRHHVAHTKPYITVPWALTRRSCALLLCLQLDCTFTNHSSQHKSHCGTDRSWVRADGGPDSCWLCSNTLRGIQFRDDMWTA